MNDIKILYSGHSKQQKEGEEQKGENNEMVEK